MKFYITQSGIPTKVKRQFEDLMSALNEYLSVEHEESGAHRQVTSSGDISTLLGRGTFYGQPRCRVYKSADQAIATSTETFLTFDKPLVPNNFITDSDYDTDTMFDQDGAGTTIRPNVKGIYLVTASVRWQANGTGVRYLTITVGSDDMGYDIRPAAPPAAGALGNQCAQSVSCLVHFDSEVLNGGQGIRAKVVQDSGGNLNALQSLSTWFQAIKIA